MDRPPTGRLDKSFVAFNRSALFRSLWLEKPHSATICMHETWSNTANYFMERSRAKSSVQGGRIGSRKFGSQIGKRWTKFCCCGQAKIFTGIGIARGRSASRYISRQLLWLELQRLQRKHARLFVLQIQRYLLSCLVRLQTATHPVSRTVLFFLRYSHQWLWVAEFSSL